MKISLFVVLFSTFVGNVLACNLSSLELNSVTFNGTNYEIDITLYIGGGVLGITPGADNATGTFAFGIAEDGANVVNLVSYTPTNITSDTTACSGFSTVAYNALGYPTVLAYVTSGCSYTCVSSTALCGRPHSQQFNFVLEVDVMPASITALGVEGNGNPVGGCVDPEMTIDFLSMLPVTWGEHEARRDQKDVLLEWTTWQEVWSSHFEVSYSLNGHNFEHLDNVGAAILSNQEHHYQLRHEDAPQQLIYYRIDQWDQDGTLAEQMILAVPAADAVFEPRIYPNPTDGMLCFHDGNQTITQISVYSSQGNLKQQWSYPQHCIDLTSFEPGVYFVEFHAYEQRKTLRVVVK